jgi:biotin carboxyl carrier protein
MPGTVISTVAEGTTVAAGDTVVVLEAMKMENAIAAPFDGVVASVACAAGELVARGATLAEVTR